MPQTLGTATVEPGAGRGDLETTAWLLTPGYGVMREHCGEIVKLKCDRCQRWLARIEGGKLYLACPDARHIPIPLAELVNDYEAWLKSELEQLRTLTTE